MKWWLECMRNYVNFRGRARRREFWMFTLFNTLVCGALLAGCCAAVGLLVCRRSAEEVNGMTATLTICGFLLLVYIWLLATFLPGLAVRVRRLHDIGLSGKWLLGYYAVYTVCLQWLCASILRFIDIEASQQSSLWESAVALWIYVRPTVVAMAVLSATGVAAMCIGSERGPNRYGADPGEVGAPTAAGKTECLTQNR